MKINNNTGAMNIAGKLNKNTNQLWKTSNKLASGNRINRAADDAAGLAIAMKMQAQIGGTSQAVRNVSDGISMIQTAEGALGGTQTMIARIEMLSVQAANGTYTNEERGYMQAEIDQIKSEINRVASSTNFNGINLLDGSVSQKNGGLTLQIGESDASEQRLDVNINAMNTAALGLSGLDVRSSASALNAIESANKAINTVSEQRASLGAAQNGLEHTANNLINAAENLTAANARIADADMAAEVIAMSTNNILQKASIAMLAHKIREPQGMLKLIGDGSMNIKI